MRRGAQPCDISLSGRCRCRDSFPILQSASTSIWRYTDDVDAAVADLRGAGVQVVAEPVDQPWGERVASVADPDGFVIHIGAASG